MKYQLAELYILELIYDVSLCFLVRDGDYGGLQMVEQEK